MCMNVRSMFGRKRFPTFRDRLRRTLRRRRSRRQQSCLRELFCLSSLKRVRLVHVVVARVRKADRSRPHSPSLARTHTNRSGGGLACSLHGELYRVHNDDENSDNINNMDPSSRTDRSLSHRVPNIFSLFSQVNMYTALINAG